MLYLGVNAGTSEKYGRVRVKSDIEESVQTSRGWRIKHCSQGGVRNGVQWGVGSGGVRETLEIVEDSPMNSE